jgi:hypothetical protein
MNSYLTVYTDKMLKSDNSQWRFVSKRLIILHLHPRQVMSIICASHLNMASRLEQ